MRLLFLSNYFPPVAYGGYEFWCAEVAHELAARGHDVSILTSRAPLRGEPQVPPGMSVRRDLHLDVQAGTISTIYSLLARKSRESHNLAAVRRIVDAVRPDAALIWGMWNISRSVPALVERLLPERTAYYLCDYWPSLPAASLQQLRAPARRPHFQPWKSALVRPFTHQLEKEPSQPLDLRRPVCCSWGVRRRLVELGVPVEHAEVVYGGIRTEEFPVGPRRADFTGQPFRVMFLGRLSPEKGLDTALRAMQLLKRHKLRACLDIYGVGAPGYQDRLERFVQESRLTDVVRFRGPVSRSAVPALFHDHDALVFPSEWEEPLGRTVLEAMAAGIPVVGTGTGGAGEILKHTETGLTFEAGNEKQLVDRIIQLSQDFSLANDLQSRARERVLAGFSLDRMVVELESFLHKMSQPSAAHATSS